MLAAVQLCCSPKRSARPHFSLAPDCLRITGTAATRVCTWTCCSVARRPWLCSGRDSPKDSFLRRETHSDLDDLDEASGCCERLALACSGGPSALKRVEQLPDD